MESLETSFEIEQLWLILKRRFIPILFTIVSIFSLSILLLKEKDFMYTAVGKILLENASSTSYLTEYGQEISSREPVADKANPLNTEIEILKSEAVIEEAVNQLMNEHGITLSTRMLLEDLTVKGIEETDILRLSYQTTNAENTATIVNTVIDVYLKTNLLLQTAEAVAAREFLEQQIPTAKADISEAEDALRRFKENNQVTSIEEESTLLSKLIQEINNQIGETQAQLAYTETQFRSLQNRLGMSLEKAIASTSLSQSQEVQRLQDELQQVRSELAIQRTIFTEEEPTVMALKSKAEALERLLNQEINQAINFQERRFNPSLKVGEIQQQMTEELIQLESQRQSLASQLNSLYNTQSEYEQRLARLPILEQQQSALTRQVEDAQLKYELLLPKLQEVRIVENQAIANARVISYAKVPQDATSLSKVYYLAAGLLAILSAGGITYLLETIDRSIRRVDQAQNTLGYPILATIPFSRKNKRRKKDLVSQGNYRILQSKLELFISEKEIKSIVITSSVPQEGKSEIASNLSQIMAQSGSQVLLVTSDPSNTHSYRIGKLEKIVNFHKVVSGEVSFYESIEQIQSNLDLLILTNKNQDIGIDLDRQKFILLINQLSKDYDLIIFDTSSLKNSTDAQILGKLVDGIIFVVRLGFIDASTALFYKEVLGTLQQKVLGQIIYGANSIKKIL